MDFREPSARELDNFRIRFCQSERTRDTLVDNFTVSVESYEQLLPDQVVFSYATGSREIHTEFVIFNIDDDTNQVRYQPVFGEQIARKIAKKAGLKLPRKMSVLYTPSGSNGNGGGSTGTTAPRKEDNRQLLLLIEFSRSLIILHQREVKPMYDPFKRIYEKLEAHPRYTVFPSEIKAINTAIRKYLNGRTNSENERFKNLQDYVAFLHEHYPEVHFKAATFNVLKSVFQQNYPGEKLYF